MSKSMRTETSLGRKPIILTLGGYYQPAYKAGGPPRSIANIVEQLSGEFSFRVVALDRDLGDQGPFPDCRPGTWHTVGKAEVLYLPPEQVNFRTLRRTLNQTAHDVLYLNSFFSTKFTILPLVLRRLGLVPRRPLVLAPRGQFSPGALQLKKARKTVFLKGARAMGLYRDVFWQASSEYEAANIRKVFGRRVPVCVAPNLRGVPDTGPVPAVNRTKRPRALSIAFLSRISPMKNLAGVLSLLPSLRGQVELHVYGPQEDAAYWDRCVHLMAALPPHVSVKVHGPVHPEQVSAVLRQHHLFCFPTLGENFGFVILEALLAGCPVLLSDRTPWRDLEAKGVGWDLPLESPEEMQRVLQHCVDMDDEVFQRLSRTAARYGQAMAADRQVVEANYRLFRVASTAGRQPLPASEFERSNAVDTGQQRAA